MKEVRRRDREIAPQESINILDTAEYGILSTVGNDGQPYGVPLSYVLKGDSIYFHCAISGHKLENIEHNAKCFILRGWQDQGTARQIWHRIRKCHGIWPSFRGEWRRET